MQDIFSSTVLGALEALGFESLGFGGLGFGL